MINPGFWVGVTAIGAYAASTAFDIELPDASRVSPAASFGPALGAAGVYWAELPFIAVLLTALGLQVVIVAFLRRKPSSSVGHAFGLVTSFCLVLAYDSVQPSSETWRTVGLLAVVALGSVTYFGADFYVGRFGLSVRGIHDPLLLDAIRAAIPLLIVLASTAGLIVVVLPLIGWITPIVMFVPVLATRNEFARWGEARRTYDETVRTLAGLAEGAGYVPRGRSARVADLCVRLGRELSLPPNRLRELELVGLLHDVGTVSLPDPDDIRSISSEQIAQATGYLLQETEYLASYADIVLDIARGKPDVPLEGRILRVAERFEELDGPPSLRLRLLSASAIAEDSEVVAALHRVVGAS